MSKLNRDARDPHEDAADDCKDLLRGLEEGHFKEYDYFFNVTMIATDKSDKGLWDACVDTIPGRLSTSYLNYLSSEFEECDFQPYPGVHLFGKESDEQIEAKKLELRPIYVEFVHFVQAKLRMQ